MKVKITKINGDFNFLTTSFSWEDAVRDFIPEELKPFTRVTEKAYYNWAENKRPFDTDYGTCIWIRRTDGLCMEVSRRGTIFTRIYGNNVYSFQSEVPEFKSGFYNYIESKGLTSADTDTEIRYITEFVTDCDFEIEWDSSLQDRFQLYWRNKDEKQVPRIYSDPYYYDEYGISEYKDEYLDMTNKVLLDNGKYLTKSYGKYKPNISFISKIPYITYDRLNSPNRFNLNFGCLSIVYGRYWKSKKGTDCFEILPESKSTHVLLMDDWGGAFNDYRGRNLEKLDAIYHRRASSNGGGSGRDYAVLPINYEYVLSEDDI